MAALPPRYEEATRKLGAAGLDLLAPFDVRSYNDLVSAHGRLAPLDTVDRTACLALLVGNTRAIWPHLRRAVVDDPELLNQDPVDRYVDKALRDCVEILEPQAIVYPSHRKATHLVSMLHAAEASGFAGRGPAHLAVHPVHGLWFALRAVVVVDWEPVVAPPELKIDLCSGCEAPCVTALEAAMAEGGDVPYAPGTSAHWRHWVQVREVCPVGRDARYTDAQIRYHYTYDPKAFGSP